MTERWIVEVKARSGMWFGAIIGHDWHPAFAGELNLTQTMTDAEASTFANRKQAGAAIDMILRTLASEYACTLGYVVRARAL